MHASVSSTISASSAPRARWPAHARYYHVVSVAHAWSLQQSASQRFAAPVEDRLRGEGRNSCLDCGPDRAEQGRGTRRLTWCSSSFRDYRPRGIQCATLADEIEPQSANPNRGITQDHWTTYWASQPSEPSDH